MKTIKNIISVITLFLISVCTTNAQKKDSSLLWKIEGKGIKTSYVFGTFHMLSKKDFLIKEKVKAAFNESEVVFLELDMDDPSLATEFGKHSLLSEGQSLKLFMDDKEYELLDNYLKSKVGVGMAQFNSIKPFALSSMIMMAYLGNDMASYEMTLIQMAQAAKKEIKGLETVAFQVGVFDEQPYDKQIDDIIKMISEDEEIENLFGKMTTIYKSENINQLYEYMDEYFNNDPALMNSLLANRNKNWIPKIAENSKDQKVFYGVGAGHLGGEEGVISLLRKEGYTVSPIID